MESVFDNGLTPEQDELISLLAEECAEVVQACMKIQRHGLFSFHPDDPFMTTNVMSLARELGDVFAAYAMLLKALPVDIASATESAKSDKLIRVRRFLHHAGKATP